MEKLIGIKERFEDELREIDYILKNVADGRVYELTGAQGDGSIAHNMQKLRKEISSLLNKIEYGKESNSEEVGRIFFSEE